MPRPTVQFNRPLIVRCVCGGRIIAVAPNSAVCCSACGACWRLVVKVTEVPSPRFTLPQLDGRTTAMPEDPPDQLMN